MLTWRFLHAVVLAGALALPAAAFACLPPPRPKPAPQAIGETDAAFAARSEAWYIDLAEQERARLERGWARRDAELWAAADRVVVVRVTRASRTWVRDAWGARHRGPAVKLRPVRWLKGQGTPFSIVVRDDWRNSCGEGSPGDLIDGEKGEQFVVFLRPGPFTAEAIIDSFGSRRAVTETTRAALGFETEPSRR